ncbi:MAG: hypothetical protein ACQGVK_19085 [Myxococcota bacterium]
MRSKSPVSILLLLLAGFSVAGCVSLGDPILYWTVEAKEWAPATDLKEDVGSLRIEPFEAPDPKQSRKLMVRIRSGLARHDIVEVRETGASAVLTGTIEVSDVREKKGVDRDGRHFVAKVASVTIHYQVSKGRRRIAGRSIRSRERGRWYGTSPAQARANAPSDQQLIDRELRRASKKLVAALTPRKRQRTIAILHGKDSRFLPARTYVENGRYGQAFGVFQDIFTQSEDPSDRAAAVHDMGVMRELKGKYGEAFGYVADADQIEPGNPIIVAALSRLEKKKQRRSRVKHKKEDADGQELVVHVTPIESRVRIENFDDAYKDGMHLPPGQYDVRVDAPGYSARRLWVEIDDEDVEIDVILDPET